MFYHKFIKFIKFIIHHRSGFFLLALMFVGTTTAFYAARQNAELRIGAYSGCMIVNRGDPDNAGCWCSDGGWQGHCGPTGSGEDSQCQRDCDALNQGGEWGHQPSPTPAADRACSSDYRTNTWCIGRNDGDIVVVDQYNNIRCYHTQVTGNDGRKLCAGELITTGNTPTPAPRPTNSTPAPTPTPPLASCSSLSGCSEPSPGFWYEFTPPYPNCTMPPSFPKVTGRTSPYYSVTSFGDYTCDLARCGGSCGTVYDCSYSYFGYSYSYIPTNYPACLPGTHACGGTSYPNWAGEDPACDFANSNGDDFTRDVACGAAACATPTPTPTPVPVRQEDQRQKPWWQLW